MPGLGFGPFLQRQGGNGMGVWRASWFGYVLPPTLPLRATEWRGNPVGMEQAQWRTFKRLPKRPLDCRVGALAPSSQ